MLDFEKNQIVTFVHPEKAKAQRQYAVIECCNPQRFSMIFTGEYGLNRFSTISQEKAEQVASQAKIQKVDHTLEDVEKVDAKLAQEIRELTAPLPQEGDCVAFENEGVRCTGRVLSEGKTLEVSFGKKEVVEGDPSCFEVIQDPEHPDPKIADYRVKNFRYVAGHGDTAGYEADITFKSQKVIFASNDGVIGQDLLQELQEGARDEFRNTLAEYIERQDELGYVDLASLWVHWDWVIRPTGISFKRYIDEFLDSLKTFRASKSDGKAV